MVMTLMVEEMKIQLVEYLAGGHNPSSIAYIEFVTIASFGNATDFGDLTCSKTQGCSDVHGGSIMCKLLELLYYSGGGGGGAASNIIDYFGGNHW